MIYLSLGSNTGNRLLFLRRALEEIAIFFEIRARSIIFETEAVVPEEAPASWDKPFCNMVVGGISALAPQELLTRLQDVERRLGRPDAREKWSPRAIDIDILLYHAETISSQRLVIPHPELAKRPFLLSLLSLIGKDMGNGQESSYAPLRSFVLDPQLVGIVNVTPDSFSDGGGSSPEVIAKAHKLYAEGASIVELGAQSTRPGYTEIPPQEEKKRLAPVLEACRDLDNLGIDSYFDDVVLYALRFASIAWINDILGLLAENTIKEIADRGLKLVTMLHGTDFRWFESCVERLCRLGMLRRNIVLDPGVGFGKTRQENLATIRNLARLKEFGCPVMLAHSRKSFMTIFSQRPAPERDIETLALSHGAANVGVNYLRVHNVGIHQRFFSANQLR